MKKKCIWKENTKNVHFDYYVNNRYCFPKKFILFKVNCCIIKAVINYYIKILGD